MSLEKIKELCNKTNFKHKVTKIMTISHNGLLFSVNPDNKTYESYPVDEGDITEDYEKFTDLFNKLGYKRLVPHI